MTRRSQLGGASRVTSLPCGFSQGLSSAAIYGPRISTLSGATSAGVLKTLLNVTGARSRLNSLAFSCADATARDVRIQITIDGTVVFNNTVSCADTNTRVAVGAVVVGALTSIVPQPVDALTSLKIEYSSSLGETDKITLVMNYEVRV